MQVQVEMSKGGGLLQLVGTGRGRLEQVVERKDQDLQDRSQLCQYLAVWPQARPFTSQDIGC